MKKTNIILAAMALLLTLSCSRKVEFKHETFVTLDNLSFAVNEKIGTLSIPVSVINPGKRDVSIIVKGIDGEGSSAAVNMVNYEIVTPHAEVLTFPAGVSTQYIEVKINPIAGKTGTKNFEVNISSATEGITVGGCNTATVKILDDDHPLKHFIGQWSGTMVSYFDGTSSETVINIDAVDSDNTFTKLKIDAGLVPEFAKDSKIKYNATATETEIVVYQDQLVGYEDYYIRGFNAANPDEMTQWDNIYFEYTSDKKLIMKNGFGVFVPQGEGGFYDIYYGNAVFTKK